MNADKWAKALTVNQLKLVAREGGGHASYPPGDNTKKGMITRLIEYMCANSEKIQEQAEDHYLTYGDTKEFFLNIGKKFDLGYASSISSMHYDESNRKTLYLMRNPDGVKINIEGFVKVYNSKTYGAVPLFLLDKLCDWTTVADDVSKQEEFNDNLLPKCVQLCIKTLHDATRAKANAFVVEFMKSREQPPFPKIPGITTYQVVLDAGASPTHAGGFPRLIYGNERFQFQTPPYGIDVRGWAPLLLSISGRTPEEYAEFYLPQHSKDYIRKLLYMISMDPTIPVMVGVEESTYTADKTLDPVQCIANLPEISTRLAGRPGITGPEFNDFIESFSLRDISTLIVEGSQYVLHKYLVENPDIMRSIPVPAYGRLGYFIEDYITPQMWGTFDPVVMYRCLPVKLVENPYLNMDPDLLRQIASSRSISKESVDIKQHLLDLDHRDPSWSDDILRSITEIRYMSFAEAGYYAYARGIALYKYVQDVPWNAKCMIQIANAGGIGKTIQDANPLPVEFIGSIFCVLNSERDHERCKHYTKTLIFCRNICKQFGIPDSNFITSTDTIKGLFVRGYIGDDYIEEKYISRIAKWEALNEKQRSLTRSLYADYRGDRDAFVMCETPIDDLEAYVAAFSEETVDNIIDSLELVVPPGTKPTRYFDTSLFDCIPLFVHKTTDDPLARLTDKEILVKVGVYIDYTSRASLIANAKSFLAGDKGFFIPYERKSINTTTFDGTPITHDTFTIAYGTLGKYVCYTLEELSEGFEPQGIDGSVRKFQILDISCEWKQISALEASGLKDMVVALKDNLPPSLAGIARILVVNISNALLRG